MPIKSTSIEQAARTQARKATNAHSRASYGRSSQKGEFSVTALLTSFLRHCRRLSFRYLGGRSGAVFTLGLLGLLTFSLFTSGVLSLLSETTHAETVLDRGAWRLRANSQTMALLSVSARARAASIGGGDITTVGEAALVAPGPRSSEDSIEPVDNPRQTSIYVVRTGDTLSGVADRFGVSVDTIRWANDLSGTTIQKGETLIILPINGVRHIVEEGDTLSGIAAYYGTDIERIREYNNLQRGEALSIGAIVDVPGGEVPEASQPEPAQPAPVVTVAQAGQAVRDKNVAPSSGYFIHPVPGSVITQRLHGYNAIDMGAPMGSSVFAAASGTVKTAVEGGWNGGYGSFVVIEHENGSETLYSHFSSVIVSPGQWVVAGQVIGYVGSTGHSTGPHVHFEVRGAKNPFRHCGLGTHCGS